jgi:PAS domain S-box-containing protein
MTTERLSEGALHALLDGMREGVVTYRLVRDAAGRVVDGIVRGANAAALRAMGRALEEVVGRHASELFGPEHVAPFALVAENVVRTGEPRSLEAEWAGRSLKETAFRAGDDVVGVVSSSLSRPSFPGNAERRRSERERAELAERHAQAALEARQNRAQLEAVFEAMADGVVVFDTSGSAVLVNEAEARIHGFASADEMRRNLREAAELYELSALDGRTIPLEDWPAPRVLRGESFTDCELRARRRDTGREWLFSFSGQPVRDERGELVLAVVVRRDVTGRARAEQALRDDEERFRAFAESIPHLAFIADPAGSITYHNGRFAEYFGIELRDTEGWRWKSIPLLHPDDLERTSQAWSRGIQGGIPFRIEYRLRRHDGRYRWHITRVAPVRDGSGRISMWAGTSTDVQDQREAAAALRSANEQLRDADRRKDEFLGMLSHELRNPLAPIANALYILDRADANGPQARRAREVANRQVAHLTRLVDDLLDVTRIVRGRIELRCAELDLAALVRRTAEDHRALMQERGLELAVEAPPGPVLVNGDETRLAQVLGNLLHNSAKFTPSGGRVALTVAIEGGAAVIRVRDTGAGIEPALLDSVFEPFTQAQQTLARSEGGLGLGLALVKGLVASHGGEVTAASEGPARGAEVVVKLPLGARAAGARPATEAQRGAKRRRRVLVVDDNEDAAETLAELVELFGHEAEVAYDGPSAVAKARTSRPDLVLCDIGLPGMDGYAVARELRADRATGVQLVAVSGYARPEDVAKAARAGFDSHVAKPLDPEKLERVLA